MSNLERIPSNANLPDIASLYYSDTPLPLKWVGMEGIAVPLWLDSENGTSKYVNAKADLYVSLSDGNAKGIHMSRLFLKLNQLANQTMDSERMNTLLTDMVESQGSISEHAKVSFEFELILEKPSLVSNETGYQAYPVKLSGQRINNRNQYQLELTIPYSSTCPCSASLSRQLYKNAIDQQFNTGAIDKQTLMDWVLSEAGSVATPHSQRSFVYLKLNISDNIWPDITTLIFQLEGVICTPVQTAVKRQDEQEFAKLNAENLMFCEDAARRIKYCLEQMTFVTDYWFKVEHQESLHAHNAVVIDQKIKPVDASTGF